MKAAEAEIKKTIVVSFIFQPTQNIVYTIYKH